MSGKAGRHFMGDVLTHTRSRDIWGMQAAENVPFDSEIWDQVTRLSKETEARMAALEMTAPPAEADLCLNGLGSVIDLTGRQPELRTGVYL